MKDKKNPKKHGSIFYKEKRPNLPALISVHSGLVESNSTCQTPSITLRYIESQKDKKKQNVKKGLILIDLSPDVFKYS